MTPPSDSRTRSTGRGAPNARSRIPASPPSLSVPTWTFLSNHAHVLLCLAERPDSLLREVAQRVGITERAVQHIVADLVESGALSRRRDGRRNRYRINADRHLRHPVESHCRISDLLDMVLRDLA